MKKYEVVGRSVAFAAGRLALSEGQAAVRAHALRHVGSSVYEVVQPVEFKQGEVIGYDGEVNKTLAPVIESVDSLAAKRPAAAKSRGKREETSVAPGDDAPGRGEEPTSSAG